MNIKKQLGYGTGIIIIANIISVSYPESYHIFTSISAILLCFFIYNLDISTHDGSLYYELGFTYTIISIVCSLVVIGLIESTEGGFKLILGNFGIALTTSAWGMILKVLSKRESSASKIKSYNDALGEMTSKMKFMGDDIIKTFQLLQNNLEKQSDRLDAIIERHDSVIQEQSSSIDAIKNDFKNDVKNVTDDYKEKIDKQINLFDEALLKNNSVIDEINIRTNESINSIDSSIKKLNKSYDSTIDKIEAFLIDKDNLLDKLNVLEKKITKQETSQRDNSNDIKNKISGIYEKITEIDNDNKLKQQSVFLDRKINEIQLLLDNKISKIENLVKKQGGTDSSIQKELNEIKKKRNDGKNNKGILNRLFKW